jgi:hypothetical protein
MTRFSITRGKTAAPSVTDLASALAGLEEAAVARLIDDKLLALKQK